MTSGGQEEPFSRLALALLCDESSPHRRILHIPVLILAGEFKMEFLPTISLTKAFPVAQIRPNLHKMVPSSISCRAPTKRVVVYFLFPKYHKSVMNGYALQP